MIILEGLLNRMFTDWPKKSTLIDVVQKFNNFLSATKKSDKISRLNCCWVACNGLLIKEQFPKFCSRFIRLRKAGLSIRAEQYSSVNERELKEVEDSKQGVVDVTKEPKATQIAECDFCLLETDSAAT